METLLLIVIAVLAVIVAVKLAYALVLLVVWVVSGVFNGIVVPVLRFVLMYVLRPVFCLVFAIVTLPLRLVALALRPLAPGRMSGLVLGTACANASCRCPNPTEARYCRRCGASIAFA